MAYERGGCLFSLTIILFANAVLKTSHAQDDDNINANPVVTIAQGKVVGKAFPCRNNNYVFGFMGIPYGQAPIGDLRFRAPLPAGGWGEEIFDGTRPGPGCLQNKQLPVRMDEDCLHMTVYTPKLPNGNDTSLMPTLVYVVGGMFVSGAVEFEVYNPGFIFDGSKKIVLALPSFRSGPFGFLSMGNEQAPGNYGLKDIVLSLEWVQKNIRFFGGDPNQVTVIGHSSGAASVHFLTLSPLTKGLFHRFGTASGTCSVGWAYTPRRICARHAELLARLIGCTQDTPDARLRCLREKPYEVILRASTMVVYMNPRELTTWHITDEPDIDGAFLTKPPDELVAAGQFHDLPWINSLTRDEGLVLSTRVLGLTDVAKELLPYFPDLLTVSPIPYHKTLNVNTYAEALTKYYFNDHTVSNAELFQNLTRWVGDTGMNYPACLVMKDWVSRAKSPVYFYSFEYVGSHSLSYEYCECSDYLGVSHADDILYFFNVTHRINEFTNKTMTDTDLKMVDKIVTMWVSFATTGVPTLGPGTPTWKPFTVAEENVLHIGQENNIVFTLGENYCRDRTTFFDNLFTKLT